MIKLADRLHNARTWRFVSPESGAKKARETLEIFAPLAHRLGMNTIKWELEDLSFAALHPKVYEEIVRMVGDRTPEREKYLATSPHQIGEDLRAAKIKATITGRPKHYYSIYQKMIVRGKDFDDIHDLMGVRVLVDSSATATRRWARCTRAGTRCPAGSRTTSRCPSSTCTSRCTPR